MPHVSVVVPAFNAASTIAETLASACAQTHGDMEILVVDDGSTDATPEIVAEFSRQDARVVALSQANGGVARARNLALHHAKGEFVAPLDADDLWHPTKIARQLARFAANPEADLVYCWSVDIDGEGMVIEQRRDVRRYEGDVFAHMVQANFIDSSSIPLIRREALRAVGGWDENLRVRQAQGCEDWLVYLRLAARGSFALEPAFLVGYRQSAVSMSRNLSAMRKSSDLVLAEARELDPETPSRVLRWARAGYDHYVADLHAADGRHAKALIARTRAIFRDPAWLASKTARRKARQLLGKENTKVEMERQKFVDVAPDPTFLFPPDRYTRRRDEQLNAYRSSGS